jgi:predicted GIY-YIG superfamily endonuclease
VYIEEQPDRSTAMKRERAIKALNHTQKARLISKFTEMGDDRGDP